MNYTEAFRHLGYDVEVPRQDWSAEKADGICISLWKREIRFTPAPPCIDTRKDSGPLEVWQHKPGNRKRILHLTKARDAYSGWIDVVVVDGIPGESYGDANPWMPEGRIRHRWKLDDFDPNTGHFHASAKPIS